MSLNPSPLSVVGLLCIARFVDWSYSSCGLCYGDNRVEALEVKNHCPFFSNRGRKRKVAELSDFLSVIDPLMTSMECFRNTSRSCNGDAMLRSRMSLSCHGSADGDSGSSDTSDTTRWWMDWRDAVLATYRFQHDFVDRSKPPPTDFFGNGEKEDRSRYRRFVNLTLELRGKVKVVERILNEMVQCIEEDAPFFLDYLWFIK